MISFEFYVKYNNLLQTRVFKDERLIKKLPIIRLLSYSWRDYGIERKSLNVKKRFRINYSIIHRINKWPFPYKYHK